MSVTLCTLDEIPADPAIERADPPNAYLGGELNGGKRGRGSEDKRAFVIAVSRDENLEHPIVAVIEPVRAFDDDSMKDWIERRLEPECEVYSDGLGRFRRLEGAGHAHATLATGFGCAATEAKGARSVSVLLANAKRATAASTMRCAREVRAPLLGRSGLPLQPPLSTVRDAAEAGQRICALQACSGASSAIGQQLSG